MGKIETCERRGIFAPWEATINVADRLNDGFTLQRRRCYLFIAMHSDNYIGTHLIEDKLRACTNLLLEDWHILGMTREISMTWIMDALPLLVDDLREISEWGKNYCLLEKIV